MKHKQAKSFAPFPLQKLHHYYGLVCHRYFIQSLYDCFPLRLTVQYRFRLFRTKPGITITDLYKKRRNIEIFFKLMEQNLQIKTFVGTSQNAVNSQIFVSLIVYLLLELIRREYCKGKTAFNNFWERVRICLPHYLSFEYICSINGKVQKVKMLPGKTLFDVDKLPVQTDLFSTIA